MGYALVASFCLVLAGFVLLMELGLVVAATPSTAGSFKEEANSDEALLIAFLSSFAGSAQ